MEKQFFGLSVKQILFVAALIVVVPMLLAKWRNRNTQASA